MDATVDLKIRQDLAQRIQRALRSHQVNSEELGATASFLSAVLGGMIGAIFPPAKREVEIESLRGDIEYGIENGVPEE